jgi:hypothetical protein
MKRKISTLLYRMKGKPFNLTHDWALADIIDSLCLFVVYIISCVKTAKQHPGKHDNMHLYTEYKLMLNSAK